MNVYGMTLLEQSVELRHPGRKEGSEFTSVEVLDRNVGKPRPASRAASRSPSIPPFTRSSSVWRLRMAVIFSDFSF